MAYLKDEDLEIAFRIDSGYFDGLETFNKLSLSRYL
jgi:hypothetical protein